MNSVRATYRNKPISELPFLPFDYPSSQDRRNKQTTTNGPTTLQSTMVALRFSKEEFVHLGLRMASNWSEQCWNFSKSSAGLARRRLPVIIYNAYWKYTNHGIFKSIRDSASHSLHIFDLNAVQAGASVLVRLFYWKGSCYDILFCSIDIIFILLFASESSYSSTSLIWMRYLASTAYTAMRRMNLLKTSSILLNPRFDRCGFFSCDQFDRTLPRMDYGGYHARITRKTESHYFQIINKQ
jgi:hypothetical protein